MEKNQVMSVAVGVGAVGTLLGYLGYSYLQNRHPNIDSVEEVVGDKVEQEVKKTSFWSSFWATEYKDIVKSEDTEDIDDTDEQNKEKTN